MKAEVGKRRNRECKRMVADAERKAETLPKLKYVFAGPGKKRKLPMIKLLNNPRFILGPKA
jgi:hypothetical protein